MIKYVHDLPCYICFWTNLPNPPPQCGYPLWWALTTGRKKEDIYDGEVMIEDRAGVAVVSDEVYALQAPPLVICCDPLINCWASP